MQNVSTVSQVAARLFAPLMPLGVEEHRHVKKQRDFKVICSNWWTGFQTFLKCHFLGKAARRIGRIMKSFKGAESGGREGHVLSAQAGILVPAGS